MRYRVIITQDITIDNRYHKAGEEIIVSSPILEKVKESIRIIEAIQDIELEDREKKVKTKEK